MALRRGELGLLKVEDFDIKHGTVRVHGKGGKVVVLPLGFKSLKRDLDVYLVGREATHYLLHPRHDRMRPMIRRRFTDGSRRACGVRAARDDEGRPSAADNLSSHRQT